MALVPYKIKENPNTAGGYSKTAPLREPITKTLSVTKSPILTYPDNVGEDPHQAHYIMFSIRRFIKGIIKVGQAGPMVKGKQKMSVEEYGKEKERVKNIRGHRGRNLRKNLQGWTQQEAGEKKFETANGKTIAMPGPGASGLNRSLTLSQKPLGPVVKNIALYMPASVTTTYAMSYPDNSPISDLADIGNDMIKWVTGEATSGETEAKLKDKTGTAMQKVGTKMMDTVAPGIKALEALHHGRIVTPRMELMFEGLGRREFSYSFTFIPKNEKESKTVHEIVQTFKLHMHPEMNNTGREFTIPDVFDIEYMYTAGKPNSFLHKISTCYLENMDITYGGDKFTAYSPTYTNAGRIGAPPQQIAINLKFKEIELIDRKRVEDGY
jgi:hypothetical protein